MEKEQKPEKPSMDQLIQQGFLITQQQLQAVTTALNSLVSEMKKSGIGSTSAPFKEEKPGVGRKVQTPETARSEEVSQLPKGTRMDFPKFEEGGPDDWLHCAEQYFEFQQTPAEIQIKLASFYLRGEALQWFKWIGKTIQWEGWKHFKQALVTRFGPNAYEDYGELLSRVRQIGSVHTYQKEFEKYSSMVDGLPESYLVSCFVGGLIDEIRVDVKVLKPATLVSAIGLARLMEDRLNEKKKSGDSGKPTRFIRGSTRGGPEEAKGSEKITKLPPIKRLSQEEMEERKKKQLCYNCDERWVAGHKCKQKTLFLLEDETDSGKIEEIEDEEGRKEGLVVSTEEAEVCQISGTALEGSLSPRTMRVTFYVKNQPFTALVDTGSTHNFIHPRLVSKLGCVEDYCRPIKVKVADGGSMSSSSKCSELPFQIQGYNGSANFFVQRWEAAM